MGGTVEKYHRKIQVIIKKAARCVTGKGNRASTKSLLEETGWMSSRELTNYFSLTEMWCNIYLKIPKYMADKYTTDDEMLVEYTPGRLLMTRRNYRWRAGLLWNSLNEECRKCQSLPRFNFFLLSKTGYKIQEIQDTRYKMYI